jgi:hypothetical protein
LAAAGCAWASAVAVAPRAVAEGEFVALSSVCPQAMKTLARATVSRTAIARRADMRPPWRVVSGGYGAAASGEGRCGTNFTESFTLFTLKDA